MTEQLLEVLGSEVESDLFKQVISSHGLKVVAKSPPSRRYYGSKSLGLNLLVERGITIDIQIFVQPAEGYKAYGETLPFEIERGMNQEMIHDRVGKPTKFDEYSSIYLMPEKRMKLYVGYDAHLVVKYLSVSLPMEFRR